MTSSLLWICLFINMTLVIIAMHVIRTKTPFLKDKRKIRKHKTVFPGNIWVTHVTWHLINCVRHRILAKLKRKPPEINKLLFRLSPNSISRLKEDECYKFYIAQAMWNTKKLYKLLTYKKDVFNFIKNVMSWKEQCKNNLFWLKNSILGIQAVSEQKGYSLNE